MTAPAPMYRNGAARPAFAGAQAGARVGAQYAADTESVVYAEAPEARHYGQLGWAMIAFAGVLTAINGFFFYNKNQVAMAATTGERDAEMGMGRREAMMSAGATASLLAASPAHALFGIGGDPKQQYADSALLLVASIKAVLVLERDDPTKPERVAALRKEMNSWVARYRRDPKFNGKASYGNLYSVINAISGHYTNFGPKTPIPKKRAAQIVQEIALVETLIPKGR